MTEDDGWDRREIGRRLGHDLVRFQRVSGNLLLPGVEEGIAVARARRLAREPADRFVGKWLQLRTSALRRGRVVDEGVTPAYLRRIDVPLCPVTKIALTHGRRHGTDWSIDRLNNDGGYAPNNLAVLSVRVNEAKGGRTFEQVLAASRRSQDTAGLSPVEWLRLASLMLGPAFAGRASLAPLLPLAAVAPGIGLPASQVVQFACTTLASTRSGKNVLIEAFRAGRGEEGVQGHLVRFADALHRGLEVAGPCWDVWLRPEVFDAFQTWWRTCGAHRRAVAGQVALRTARGGPVPRGRVESWQLAARGYLQ